MQNILIIGANSAIATACARIWATRRARFFLVGRDSENLQQLGADLQARGATAVYQHILDVNRRADHALMLETCLNTLTTVHIAMVAHGTLPDQNVCEQDVNSAVAEFTTNGLSVIALLTLLSNRLQAQRSGTLAVISSVAGDRGRPGNYLYGAAKAAVTTFCQGLRARLFKYGVHVLTIKPGFVDTPMTRNLKLPAVLLATPHQVAQNIVRAVDYKQDTLYTPWFWWGIMAVIRNIPEKLFKRLRL